ncbi:MAG: RagB/SusD family nutrient uptake outer membrane protein [Pedobacter sp.]|uniref:RagB/SusD family nutrient uptake outer membrane protein n=1 Tax=Pedobacter sp. TaxID=1411316 RepID=UPI0035645234
MKSRYYILLTLLILSVSSCEKILDKEPLDFIADVSEYYNTPEKLESSMLGIYDVLQSGDLYGFQMLYITGFEADEGYYNRESPTDGPHMNNFSAGNSRVNNFWATLYKGIGRVNTLLRFADSNPSIDVKLRDKYKGEAKFLRGYFYFMLVQNFGGVPLILEPLDNVEDVDIPRNTAKEIYNQIIKDMEDAEKVVPGIKELGFGGRVSKSAVRGILARVCLHMAGYPLRETARFADARKWAKMVMDDTEAKHSLNPSFSQIFINYAQDKYDVNESIWEVEFTGNGTGGAYSETGGVGYLNGPQSTNTTIGESFGGVKVTSKLYKIYEQNYAVATAVGDLRRDWTIANFAYSAANKVFITSTTPVNLYNRFCGKFRREYETNTPKHRTQTPQNFPLLRFSDVLLMFAEADNEVNNGPGPDAVEAVNKVRRRALAVGGIKNFGINAAGSGYNSAPTVVLTNGGGTGASIKAVVTAGAITGFTLDQDAVTGVKMGYNYDTPKGVGLYVTITPTNGGTLGRANARIWHEDEASMTAAQIASAESFREFIQNERLRELAFECLRKGDLQRWGNYVFEMKAVATHIESSGLTDRFYYLPYKNTWSKHNLWPIPAREMNLNNKLVQNPSW